MTQEYVRIPTFKTIISVLLVVLSLFPVLAQDNNSESLPNTVIEIDAKALTPEREIIVIRESIGLSLAVVGVTVDGQAVWTRKNSSLSPINGVVEWYFDEPSRQLLVALSGITQQGGSAEKIVIEVAPVNLRTDRYEVLVSAARSVEDARKRDQNPPLTNVNIEFKR
jgi:hypothetical protein